MSRRRLTTLLLLAIGGLHVALTWGNILVWWGDAARWMNEMDRYAQGAAAYTEFFWPFPPMAMWLLGGVLRVVGSDTSQVFACTAVLFLLVVALFGAYGRRLVGDRDAPLLLPPVLVGVIAQAQVQSPPLSVGQYVPAVPVGFGFLLAAILLLTAHEQLRPRSVVSALGGIAAGAAFLSKHDFWLPAVAVVLLLPLLSDRRRFAVPAAWVGFLGCLSSGAWILRVSVGPGAIADVARGYGMVEELAAYSIPHWEPAVLAVIAGALGAAAFSGCMWWSSGRSGYRRGVVVGLGVSSLALGLYLGATGWIVEAARSGPSPGAWGELGEIAQTTDRSWIAIGVRRLGVRLGWHAFSPLLLLLACAWAWRRRDSVDRDLLLKLGALALVCFAARVRRNVRWTDWYQVALEAPLVLALVRALAGEHWRASRRPVWALAVVLSAGALVHHWNQGAGPFTRTPLRTVETPRGSIRVTRGTQEEFDRFQEAMDTVDPERTDPLFALGFTGGFAYFHERPNPIGTDHGLAFGKAGLMENVRELSRVQDRLWLIEVATARTVRWPRWGPWWLRWEPETWLSVYGRIDAGVFDRLRQGCPRLAFTGSAADPYLALYRCGPRQGGRTP